MTMWETIRQALILLGQIVPLIPKPRSDEDRDGTPSMRDVAIAQESGAVASRAGKDASTRARASRSAR